MQMAPVAIFKSTDKKMMGVFFNSSMVYEIFALFSSKTLT